MKTREVINKANPNFQQPDLFNQQQSRKYFDLRRRQGLFLTKTKSVIQIVSYSLIN